MIIIVILASVLIAVQPEPTYCDKVLAGDAPAFEMGRDCWEEWGWRP